MSENDYDGFAAAYQADNENNAWNAYYEWPAVLSMLGDVAGLRGDERDIAMRFWR